MFAYYETQVAQHRTCVTLFCPVVDAVVGHFLWHPYGKILTRHLINSSIRTIDTSSSNIRKSAMCFLRISSHFLKIFSKFPNMVMKVGKFWFQSEYFFFWKITYLKSIKVIYQCTVEIKKKKKMA